MATREWGTISGWVMGISLVLAFTVGYLSEGVAGFFLFVALCASASWAGLGVRASVEEYKSPAEMDLDARLQADTRAAHLRDLIEKGK